MAVHHLILRGRDYWQRTASKCLQGQAVEEANQEIAEAWTKLPADGGTSFTTEEWNKEVTRMTGPMSEHSHDIITKHEDCARDAALRARHIAQGFSKAEREASEAVALSVNRNAARDAHQTVKNTIGPSDDASSVVLSLGGPNHVSHITHTCHAATETDGHQSPPSKTATTATPPASTTNKDFKNICYSNLGRKNRDGNGFCTYGGCTKLHICAAWFKNVMGAGPPCQHGTLTGLKHPSPAIKSKQVIHERPNCKHFLGEEGCNQGRLCTHGHGHYRERLIAEVVTHYTQY